MIIEKQKEAVVIIDDESKGSTAMSLDLESAQFLMQMLSKNLYSDAIGSTIRETASNALDSHRRAGVDDPIVVTMTANKNYAYEFTVEDFGLGLDDKDVTEIISKYGKSTKRDSAEEFGMFGLGFKSPLAYSSSFTFITRKDGMERMYMMYEGEDTNMIDLLYEKPTDKKNGTKVIVPVKSADSEVFINKIEEQLCYFRNVYFDVRNWSGENQVPNNFHIYYHELFQVSEITTDKHLHLCLDDVYYPIDFDKLGIDPIETPVALRFSLTDGIFPTPNRESIRYTQEAKTIIIDRIKQLADHFVDKFNNDNRNHTIHTAWSFSKDSKFMMFLELGDKTIALNITKLSNFSKVRPEIKIEGAEHISIVSLMKEDHFTEAFVPRFEIGSRKTKVLDGSYDAFKNLTVQRAMENRFYYYEKFIDNKKLKYLKYLESGRLTYYSTVQVLKKRERRLFKDVMVRGGSLLSYYRLLNLKDYPRDQWRMMIQEFQYVQESIVKIHGINVADIKIPQSWIDDQKSSRSYKKVKIKVEKEDKVNTNKKKKEVVKLEGSLVGKIAQDLERYTGANCKFVPFEIDMCTIHSSPYVYVYTDHDNSAKVEKLYSLMKSQKVRFITLSPRAIKSISKIQIHNLIPYEKFMEGDLKPFRRIASSVLIARLKRAYSKVFSYREVIKPVSAELYKALQTLDEYVEKNHLYGRYYWSDTAELTNPIIEVAEAKDLYDETIHDTYLYVKAFLEEAPFIREVVNNVTEKEVMTKFITDLMKLYKIRMDYENYSTGKGKYVTKDDEE